MSPQKLQGLNLTGIKGIKGIKENHLRHSGHDEIVIRNPVEFEIEGW
jgi:hypothetical protein